MNQIDVLFDVRNLIRNCLIEYKISEGFANEQYSPFHACIQII